MPHPEVVLNRPMRIATEAAIRQHCEFRGWQLHALNVRTNHVHIVITAEEISPADALAQLKARATRQLREVGLSHLGVPVWARHGSTPAVWSEEDLAQVVDYVLFQQGSPLT